MNTFLTSFNLCANFAKLDNKRLFKNLLESVQLLDGIVNNKDGWRKHPARKMWEKNPYGLFLYIFANWNECVRRKIAPDSLLWQQAVKIQEKIIIPKSDLIYPSWLTDESVHSSHRSRLRCKGFIDAACVDIKRDLKIKSINRWLKEKFKLEKNQLRFPHLEKLKATPGVTFSTPSHYEQFGWSDDPAADYVWPV